MEISKGNVFKNQVNILLKGTEVLLWMGQLNLSTTKGTKLRG